MLRLYNGQILELAKSGFQTRLIMNKIPLDLLIIEPEMNEKGGEMGPKSYRLRITVLHKKKNNFKK